MCLGRRRWIGVLDECDVVALQHDASQRPAVLRLHMVLLGVVQHKIHVLVESDDVALDAQRDVLVQPHLDARPILQIAEDQVDGLHHHLLHLGIALERHGGTAVALRWVFEEATTNGIETTNKQRSETFL